MASKLHADFSTSTSDKKIDWNAETFKNIFYMKVTSILTGAPFLIREKHVQFEGTG